MRTIVASLHPAARRFLPILTLATVACTHVKIDCLPTGVSAATDGRVVAAAGVVPGGSQQPSRCRVIPAVPFIITEPGEYCLASSLTHNEPGAAITIRADNVTIDGRGYCVNGPSTNDTKTQGIRSVDHSAITIRNVCMRGFQFGIIVGQTDDTYVSSPESYGRTVMGASRDILIENVSVERANMQGIHVRAATNVVIRDSAVSHTGGSTSEPNSFATGIQVEANSCIIENNRVLGLYPTGTGEGIGVVLYHGRACKVTRNLVDPLRAPEFGRTYGFWIRPERGESPFVSSNFVHDTDYGFGPWGTYSGNVAVNVTCRAFVDRKFSIPDSELGAFLFESDTRIVSSHLKRGCPDDIEAAVKRAYDTGRVEAIYGAAAAMAEQEPSQHAADYIAWLIIAKEYGHPTAIATLAAQPTAGLDQATYDEGARRAATIRARLEKTKPASPSVKK